MHGFYFTPKNAPKNRIAEILSYVVFFLYLKSELLQHRTVLFCQYNTVFFGYKR